MKRSVLIAGLSIFSIIVGLISYTLFIQATATGSVTQCTSLLSETNTTKIEMYLSGAQKSLPKTKASDEAMGKISGGEKGRMGDGMESCMNELATHLDELKRVAKHNNTRS